MRWIAIAGVLAVAAFAVGCGSEDSGTDTSAQTDAAAVGEDEAMKKEEAKADGDAMKKDGDAKKKDGGAMKGEAAGAATIEVVESQYGSVIADGSGEALYLLDKESGSTSECYGECAEAWPPLLTSGDPKAGSGAEAGLLGTTERNEGELQVTYNGHPLYYYVDDSPGTILCQNVDEFGGLWLVVQPDGEAVT
jgi:predicted lipoprotein with Yx(FWY)xxD motif